MKGQKNEQVRDHTVEKASEDVEEEERRPGWFTGIFLKNWNSFLMTVLNTRLGTSMMETIFGDNLSRDDKRTSDKLEALFSSVKKL